VVIALVLFIHFSVSFGSIDTSSLFALVQSIIFPTFVWFCRYLSPFVWVSFVLSNFSNSGCRVATHYEPIYWPFVGECVGTVFSNLHPDIGLLQFISSPKHLQREVLCDYPVVEGIGYREVEGVCAGVVVLNSEYQDTHNQENQSYIGTSCRFSPTHRSEIRKVWGYHYLCVLGRGSNLLLHPWFASEA